MPGLCSCVFVSLVAASGVFSLVAVLRVLTAGASAVARASLAAQTGKCLPAMQETRVGKIPWRRKWQPTPVFLPEKSHGQRSLVDYSPWGHKEFDTTEQLHSLLLQSTCSGLHGLQDLQHMGSVLAAPMLSDSGAWFSRSVACWIFPPGIKPESPALTGGFCH